MPESLRKKYYNDYVEFRKIDYSEWCNICIDQFREKGLAKNDFKNITRSLSVTKNLREVISTLKRQGFITAIISGGIDTFLAEMILDYEELFDYVFINKFIWDEDGKLIGVEPTKYDFEGKIEAIKYICKKEKIKTHQVIFVGEGRNDEDIFHEFMISGNGFSVAYPGTESSVEHRANATIYEDDMYKVLDVIPLR